MSLQTSDSEKSPGSTERIRIASTPAGREGYKKDSRVVDIAYSLWRAEMVLDKMFFFTGVPCMLSYEQVPTISNKKGVNDSQKRRNTSHEIKTEGVQNKAETFVQSNRCYGNRRRRQVRNVSIRQIFDSVSQ